MYIYGARDHNGDTILFQNKPVADDGHWQAGRGRLAEFIELDRNTLGLKKGECAKFTLVRQAQETSTLVKEEK